MDERHTCEVKDGLFVEPCESLLSNMDNNIPGFSAVRGIAQWSLTNMKTGKPARSYFGVKSKKHKNGFLFNFCPFCGTDISAPFMQTEDQPHD